MKKTSETSPRKPAEQTSKPLASPTVRGASPQKADDKKSTTKTGAVKTVAPKAVETKPVAHKPGETKTGAKFVAKSADIDMSLAKTVEAQASDRKKSVTKTVEAQPIAQTQTVAETRPVAQNSEGGKDPKTPLSASDGEFISDYDIYLFREGRHRRIYEKLGAHVIERGGKKGTHFGVWAPNASSVSVVGDFNAWDGRTNPLHPIAESGIWGGFIAGVDYGALYKYELHDHNGHLLPLKSDPYAFGGEMRPSTASVVTPFPKVERSKIPQTHRDPITIYEVHLGSWRRGDGDRFLTYNELADQLIPYAKDMGFTHIELLPITEHPFDGSWGYQPVGLFAPTSRFGTAEEFAAFVRRAHEAGIGILLDWVPGHFPNDPHGLAFFDGTHLYDHQDPREGMHEDWGTMIYNFGRIEVANFLLSNAQFWLDRYGLDGLRVDAVASMIYRNYSRKPGQWVPNKYGEVENLEATAFLREMNASVFGEFPQATTVAEESTAWPGVSRPVHLGGLGFGFKWNMGWMHDTLNYMAEDPVYRKYHHHNMTFGLLYGFTENFVLPLSHDEVVHGKHSLLGRMPGDEWQRFANLRAYYGFMYGHPGKKLLFMGSEIAPYGEWNHDRSLDWHLLQYPVHSGIQALVRDLNHLYKSTPSLYSYDCEQRGFEWIESHAAEVSVLAFLRRGDEGDPITVVVSNFTPVPRNDYRIGVPHAGFYEERLNTDSAHYGGTNVGNDGGRQSDDIPWDGRPYSINLNLPPLGTVFLVLKGNK